MPHVYLPRQLPDALQPMVELALDLRWSSSRAADRFWSLVDEEAWRQSASSWLILENISDARLNELAASAEFAKALKTALDERAPSLDGPNKWFRKTHGDAVESIAYFSMEFGLGEDLPLYSGGLGILAGDYLKSSSDIGLPVTGVGLLYQEGYFRQVLTADGWQQEIYPYNSPIGLPIQPVMTEQGWLRVTVPLPGRQLRLRIWKAQVGSVTLYLLDSDDPTNSPSDCGITGKLYGGNQEMRIQQELVLGIGGWRALEALKVPTQICHLNEGHAAFVVLERARAFAERNRITFWEALWATRAGNIFTTHTAVAAGFDRFEPGLTRKYLSAYLAAMGGIAPTLEDVLALGHATGWSAIEPFNMAYLAMRGCGYANGVSKLHGEVSRDLFSNLFPRWPDPEVPVTSVTNGVHVPSWVSESAEHVWTRHGMEAVTDDHLLKMRNWEREKLVRFARHRLKLQLGHRGSVEEEAAAADSILDPNILTLGFARRFAQYKRPNLLLRDPARFARLLTDPQRPVQIIIAGKAHPADEGGKYLIQNWVRWILSNSAVRNRAVFLEDYDMDLARHLAAGVDVWINNPRRPWEASGTSGMKLLPNGGVNLSELDGWWVEGYAGDVGWAIGDGQVHPEGYEDAAEAEQLYRILEQEVIPGFYDRDEHGIPHAWLARVRASMTRLTPQFSSDRMCRDYTTEMYLKAAPTLARRVADGGKTGRELALWEGEIEKHWHEVRFGAVEHPEENGQYHFRVEVFTGSLSPDFVRVELYAEPGVLHAMTRTRNLYEVAVPAGRPVADYTPRVTPYHPAAILPMEDRRIVWAA